MKRAIVTTTTTSLLLGALLSTPALAERLADCAAPATAAGIQSSTTALADHLRSGYAASHPTAVTMADALAELSGLLQRQLTGIEPAAASLDDAWVAFGEALRRSPISRDPALRSALTVFRNNLGTVQATIGCDGTEPPGVLVPCDSIPIAHALHVYAGQIDEYLVARYGDAVPDMMTVAKGLDDAAATLHQRLHDVELAVQSARGLVETIDTGLSANDLTDPTGPAAAEVVPLLEQVRAAFRGFEATVASCPIPAAAHAGHEHGGGDHHGAHDASESDDPQEPAPADEPES